MDPLGQLNGFEHASLPPGSILFSTPDILVFTICPLLERILATARNSRFFPCLLLQKRQWRFPSSGKDLKEKKRKHPKSLLFFFFFHKEFSPAPGRNPGLPRAFLVNYFGDWPISLPKIQGRACCHALMATVLRKTYLRVGWNNIMERYPKRVGRNRNSVIPEED